MQTEENIPEKMNPLSDSRKIVVIMGPTAGGKSALSLELAERFGGEIITADSMQLYRGLDVGVAKPSHEEQQRIPHHLLDILDFGDKADVYQYVEMADRAVAAVRQRGRMPFITGGTGFYLRAFLYGLDSLPGDEKLRAELDLRYDYPEGFEDLKRLMAEKDPQDFSLWHRHRRKLIRALEVFELTGKPLAVQQTKKSSALRYPVVAWVLCREREELRERIRLRTRDMLANGWIEEAERMLARGLLQSPTARQAIGYAIIGDFLAKRINYETMARLIETATWQYARRQMTWFRGKHPEAEMIRLPQSLPFLCEKLAAALHA